MKIGVIVQSRYDSSRFRGKALAKLSNGEKTLEFLLRRLKSPDYKLILATAETKDCDSLELVAKQLNVSVFRGSKSNVLHRFIKCSEKYKLDTIVRITGDCPLIDKDHILKFINIWKSIKLNSNNQFLVTNKYPFSFFDGFDVEVFSSSYLTNLNIFTSYFSMEHVTTFLYKSPRIRKVNVLSNPVDLFSKIRLVLDYKEDLSTINNILEDYIIKFPSDINFDLLNIERIMQLPIFEKYYLNPDLAPNYKYLLQDSLIFV